ncbi:MAG: (d)CMP kinase [bacterium]|jgi:cytidylate kinase
MIITIDGPTASGKGSLAKAIASHKGYFYLDTGLLYRGIGYIVRESYNQYETAVGAFWTPDVVSSYSNRLTYRYEQGTAHVCIDGVEVTGDLRTPSIDWYASHVSSVPVVRAGLRALQQELGRRHDIVIDGRDCGTVIFPHASHKFFITASLEVRVLRAHADKVRHAQAMPLHEIAHAVMMRDLLDLSRPVSPLRPAHDALILDTTQLGLEASIALVLSYL